MPAADFPNPEPGPVRCLRMMVSLSQENLLQFLVVWAQGGSVPRREELWFWAPASEGPPVRWAVSFPLLEAEPYSPDPRLLRVRVRLP